MNGIQNKKEIMQNTISTVQYVLTAKFSDIRTIRINKINEACALAECWMQHVEIELKQKFTVTEAADEVGIVQWNSFESINPMRNKILTIRYAKMHLFL